MATFLSSPQHAACECGACRFEVNAGPVARFICHCTICQAYTGRAFSDATLLLTRNVSMSGVENIAFKKYRSPPNISRGTCTRCGKPAIEMGSLGPVKITFIPTPNFSPAEWLPPVAMHMFYHRRRADALDASPKHHGYLRSELAFGKLLMGLYQTKREASSAR